MKERNVIGAPLIRSALSPIELAARWGNSRQHIYGLMKEGLLKKDPVIEGLAAISVGIHKQVPILDLCYLEDSSAEVDANFVMTESGKIIEVQGTAEGAPFSKDELMQMMTLAEKGIGELVEMQKAVLG